MCSFRRPNGDRRGWAEADVCIAHLTRAPSGTAQTVGFAREKGIEVIYV